MWDSEREYNIILLLKYYIITHWVQDNNLIEVISYLQTNKAHNNFCKTIS